MNKLIVLLCALMPGTEALAQNKVGEYWQQQPKIHAVPAELANESSIIIEENTAIKYEDGADNKVWMHRTVHRIIKVLDNKGIEDFNTMSAPVYANQELETMKARTILPNGTVIEVSKDKMKESKGDDGKTNIVFALDGVEKNAEIEWIMTYKKLPAWYGSEDFQFTIPVVHASFELSSPTRLKFEEKGYQGFPTVKDTVIGDVRLLQASKSNIPSLRDEPMANYQLNRMRADYKLSYQEKNANVRIFTWQELTERLYANTYTLSDKEEKAVENYLRSIGVTQEMSEEDKIKKIENAIKSGITLYKVDLDENALKLNNLIANKTATEASMTRLFAACFRKSGVKHELGMTNDRNSIPFDPDFENWNTVEKFVFYFPDRKRFISPVSPYIRYPFTDADVISNKALFCKMTTIGDITRAITDIRTITQTPATESQNNVNAEVAFSADMETSIRIAFSFTGYCAMGIREAFLLLPKEKHKDLLKTIIGVASKPEDIQSSAISGEAFEYYSSGKPLVVEATVKAPQLVENAGSKFLFRLGDVIGKQSELYQVDERKQPAEMNYPHLLKRTITVNVPAGYKVLNPEATKMKTEYKDKQGAITAYFLSDYKLDGNKLEVNIVEAYEQIYYPLADFDNFRKVINAAADFNKITLLLGKI